MPRPVVYFSIELSTELSHVTEQESSSNLAVSNPIQSEKNWKKKKLLLVYFFITDSNNEEGCTTIAEKTPVLQNK